MITNIVSDIKKNQNAVQSQPIKSTSLQSTRQSFLST